MIGRNRARAAQSVATLQYANNKPVARMTPGKGSFNTLVGFHVEVGKVPALTEAARAAGIPEIEIRHQRKAAPSEIVRHHYFGEQVKLYVVTSGPVASTVGASLAGGNRKATISAGIGIYWGEGEDERSRVAVRCYLGDLVDVGFVQLVQLSTRSHMTDVLLGALTRHAQVCEAADGFLGRSAANPVSFPELGLLLGPGDEAEWGKREATTVVPFTERHPQEIDAAYIDSILAPETVVEAANADWESVQEWARRYSEGEESYAPREQPREELAEVGAL